MDKFYLHNFSRLLLSLVFLYLSVCYACKSAGPGVQLKPLRSIHQARSLRDLNKTSNIMLFDFTKIDNLDEWVESSDTVREVGMSKSSFVLQKTQVYQRAIFFALLNPQENGACFAGYRTGTDFDSSHYTDLELRLRGFKGDLWRYKILLTNQRDTYQRSYEAFFNVNDTCHCQQLEGSCNCEVDVTLPLDSFEAYYRGRPDPDAPPLNSSNVVSLGIQAAGGVYEDQKQSGVGAIEIDWITLISS